MYEGEQHTNFDAAAPITSTQGTQLEIDLEEALEIIRESLSADVKPWELPWKKRAAKFLEQFSLKS